MDRYENTIDEMIQEAIKDNEETAIAKDDLNENLVQKEDEFAKTEPTKMLRGIC